VGTPDLYPFLKTHVDNSLLHFTIRPRFVGLAARPRAATLPHTIRQDVRKQTCGSSLFSRGCSAPAAVALERGLRSPTLGRGARLAARGRPAKPGDAHPKGFPRRGSRTCHDSLAGAPGYRTFDARLRCAVSDKAGQNTSSQTTRHLQPTRERGGRRRHQIDRLKTASESRRHLSVAPESDARQATPQSGAAQRPT
jgi:hypothetical protein